MNEPKAALTIAGSDSGGGAGIEADVRTFSALGVHPLVAVTAVTAQNTREVSHIFELPSEVLKKQLEAIFSDFMVSAAKTGMLHSSESICTVVEFFEDRDIPLVVDPIFRASSGKELLRSDALRNLKEKLFPLATLLTPNIPEAELLSDMKIESFEDMKRAAETLLRESGAEAVLLKGGHLKGNPKDLLLSREGFRVFSSPRLPGCTHGTGCTLSAAIAALLAKGFELEEAVLRAREFVRIAIYHGVRVGSGDCPVNPTAWLEIPAERWRILEALMDAREMLRKKISSEFMLVAKIPGYLGSDEFLELKVSGELSLKSTTSSALSERDFKFALLVKGKFGDFGVLEISGEKYSALFASSLDEIISSL